jgi:saccharopine dehydrogenase-like NADP-dependent oxidoreductase
MLFKVTDTVDKIKEFYSYCGGIPAPEIADNPLGFKFSWSPRGALLSQCNSASFLKDGHRVNIPAESLMATAKPYHVVDGYSFVAYPNRDSVPFREFYRIPEAVTVIRGSLRYAGNPAFVKALADLDWLSQEKKSWLTNGSTWAEVTQKAIGARSVLKSDLEARVKELCNFESEVEAGRIVAGLEWFGLFSDDAATIRQGNLLDTLCAQLEKLLSYKSGERDLVMLQHKFIVEWEDGKTVSYCPRCARLSLQALTDRRIPSHQLWSCSESQMVIQRWQNRLVSRVASRLN